MIIYCGFFEKNCDVFCCVASKQTNIWHVTYFCLKMTLNCHWVFVFNVKTFCEAGFQSLV